MIVKGLYSKEQWIWAAERVMEGYFMNDVAKFLGTDRRVLQRHMVELGYLPEIRHNLPDLSERRDEFLALDCRDWEAERMTKIQRDMRISKNLRWLRKLHRYTQKILSKRLRIPPGTLGGYECGSGIGKERIETFCNFWGVDAEHLAMDPEDFQEWYRKEFGYGSQASR